MGNLDRYNSSYTRAPKRKSWGGKFKRLLGGGKSSKEDKLPVNLGPGGYGGDDSSLVRRRNTTMGISDKQRRQYMSHASGLRVNRVNENNYNSGNIDDSHSPMAAIKTTSLEELCSPKTTCAICEHCEARRVKLNKLQREIDRMRDLIIKDPIVTLEPPENIYVSPEVLELVEESAKLRITIDSLMRFQSFEIADAR